MISHSLIKKIYMPRHAWSRKGDFGRLLVVGGSSLYSGSPIFNALAAYRAGCDLVKIAAPEPAAAAVKAYLPDLIAYPLEGNYLSKFHVKTVLEMQKDADAMVIGGGLTRNKVVLDAVSAIISKTKIPAVIDADAIHAIAKSKIKLSKNSVVTPHSHEFFVLSGKKVTIEVKERAAAARELASRINSVVLLKGHIDIISDGKRVALNKTGSPYMTKGGFGDTLAGITAALLARGVSAFDAACAAAYINGRAGELAAKKFGESMLASDMINEIPHAIM
ncbi:MAG: NAD(P)H-hydrate dehydratase [Candidatus Aenigmarchaeota archaeon]|nr:NAD(P)H-hydrate dehydratase [Candidatus Aenigmarchaeota archaeon]